MNPEEIRATVVKDMNIQHLPTEMQEQIIDQFTENVLRRVTIALYERLPETAKAEFEKLGEKGDSNGLLKLFQANVPNLETFVRAEIQDEVRLFKEFQEADQKR